MKIRALPLFLLLPLLSGCVSAPASRLTYNGSTATAYLPKDFTADSVRATVGTNGFTFEATKMSTKNNPDVINASTAQLESVINATSAAVGQAAATAAKAAAK